MQQPDDMELKAEIDEIANRIDHIMETIEHSIQISTPGSDSREHKDAGKIDTD